MTQILLDTNTRPPIVQPLGITSPPLTDVILAPDGSTQNLVGTTVVFFMRPLLSRAPIIDAGMVSVIWPPNSDGNTVQYDWQTADVSNEGQFMGWWGYTLADSTLAETPEFLIIITDHGPGYGAETGVIVDALSQWMPTTITKLREDAHFGDRFLQTHADYVKRVVMGTVVSPDLEVNYDPLLVEYLAKRTALRLIAPAKDYWARQHRQVTTQGPSESASYPDMLANLDRLQQILGHELPHDWLQLQYLVPNLPQLRVEPMPMSSLGDPQAYPYARPVTPDPSRNGRPRVGGPRWDSWFVP